MMPQEIRTVYVLPGWQLRGEAFSEGAVVHEHRATQSVMPQRVKKRVHRFMSLVEESFVAQSHQGREGFTRKKAEPK
jgi:hypothetical protein